MSEPLFLDIEASSLGSRSYPIEIAWSTPSGCIDSMLINPYHVPGWTDWDPAAQAVHGLSREKLRRHGRHPMEACERLNEALADQDVYCDGGEYDRMWLDELYRWDRAMPGAPSCWASFVLRDLDALLATVLPEDLMNNVDRLMAFKDGVRTTVSGRHRAESDVTYLMRLYQEAIDWQGRGAGERE